MIALLIFLLCAVQELQCLDSCGCIEYPGGNLATALDKDEQQQQLVHQQQQLQLLYKEKIQLFLGVAGGQTCRDKCASRSFHWHSTVQGNCVCGWDVAVIECEEEVGPVIDVFCIQQEYDDNLYDEVSFYQQQRPRTSYYPMRPAGGNAAAVGQARPYRPRLQPDPYQIDPRRHIQQQQQLQAIRASNRSQLTSGGGAGGARRSTLQAAAPKSATTVVTKDVAKDESIAEPVVTKDAKGNKILALVLGLTCLFCLGVAALKVYFQLRDASQKDKRKTSMENPEIVQPQTRVIKNPPTINNTFSVTTKL